MNSGLQPVDTFLTGVVIAIVIIVGIRLVHGMTTTTIGGMWTWDRLLGLG